MNNLICFVNAQIITPFQVINDGVLIVEGDIIKELGPSTKVMIPENARLIDVKGAYISPGFIDLHLHGAWGVDVMTAKDTDYSRMTEGLASCGVTSFLPTTSTGPWEQIEHAVDAIFQAMRRKNHGAKILGAHLEGPYFNQEQRGAQDPKYIINPEPEKYLALLDKYPCIIRISAAPELPYALELGQELKRRGILAAIGHSNATYQQVLIAIEHGYTHVTHIYSGMSTVHRVDAYRVSGVLEATLILDELTTEMIADGHHLPPSLMKLVLKTKGFDKVCLVTDSTAVAGLEPKNNKFGRRDVIVEANIPEIFEIPTQECNYVAKLIDRSAFAGSVATVDQLVRNMVKLVGINVLDAIKLVTYNPARFQGLDHKLGILTKGRAADFTIFDSDINVQATFVDGKSAYQKEGTKY
jgi:N-acetylglucosamine-6-phosphate deacetylase